MIACESAEEKEQLMLGVLTAFLGFLGCETQLSYQFAGRDEYARLW